MNHTQKMNKKHRRQEVLFKHLSRNLDHESMLDMFRYKFYHDPSGMKITIKKVVGNYNHISLFPGWGGCKEWQTTCHVFRRTKNNKIDVLPYRHIHTDPVTMKITTEYYKKK